jgi:hypothetical protein
MVTGELDEQFYATRLWHTRGHAAVNPGDAIFAAVLSRFPQIETSGHNSD